MPRIPKYREIVDWVQEQIYSGRLRRDDRLMTENELCAQFGTSRQTVRRALVELAMNGLIESRRGSGSYVIYRPQPPRRQSRAVGVVTTYLDTYIFPSIVRGIEHELSGAGYSLQLALTQNRPDAERRALRSMLENGVAGIILEPARSALPSLNLGLYEKLRQAGVALLFINSYCPHTDIPHVSLDDRAAGRLAAQTLLRAGHRTICGIFNQDDYQGHLRFAGYADALREAGLEADGAHVLWYTSDDRHWALDSLLPQRMEGCTGVVCYNDELAVSVLRGLQREGLSVPGDISVVSIDDSSLARLGPAVLTSVRHPQEKLGEKAAVQLLAMMDGRAQSAAAQNAQTRDATFEFPARLNDGATVAPPQDHDA